MTSSSSPTPPPPTPTSSSEFDRAVARRRSVAVISHPDAGKTTLTEHLLATSGSIVRAGMVKSKGGAQTTTDWMALERERGISVTSSAVCIETDIATINLLDTPGHGDFSEDTYRVLSAVDSAIMLLDGAKGIEPQTRRLFEVCRARNTPIITFINKLDRPARDPLDLLHEVETELELKAVPMTWPVGDGERFGGLVHLPDLGRTPLDPPSRHEPNESEWSHACDDGHLAWEAAEGWDVEGFLAGHTTPVLFGAAVRGWGVSDLIDLLEHLAPPPQPMVDVEGIPRPLESEFSGFVFKLQSNMDPRHRDVAAFVRITSGSFERGMKASIARSGRTLVLSQAHEPFGRSRSTVEVAYPGDVIVLPNAADLRIGDTLYAGRKVIFPQLKTFAPELFRAVVNTDTAKQKQFQRGLQQLSDEGVVQLLVDQKVGRQRPIVAAAGQLQFEVFLHRMQHEFNAPVRLDAMPYTASAQARIEDEPEIRLWRGAAVYHRTNGTPLVLFSTRWSLEQHRRDKQGVLLSDVLD